MTETNDSMDTGRPARTEREGDTIRCYQLCERLGEGGFGIVWRAEQTEPVRREVALKILKLGMDTRQVLRRFGQERQALATLEHPGIATLLDAGATADGRPWFAMELVKGAPITRWCEEETLPVEERLRLFQQVCLAVHHAHQAGIIHRDLKPTNVLVTRVDSRPVAKVIDFGIAKCMQTEAEASLLTLGGQALGTPCYMSPEQTQDSASVDIRSDVYALGVLLYELLTSALPIDAATVGSDDVDEIKRAIRESTPERPSTRTRPSGGNSASPAPVRRLSISPDLDWITLRALEKDPARRYQTAAELSDDIEQHLNSGRVLARPPSWSYATRRWVKRHGLAISISLAGATITTALIATSLHLTKEASRSTPAPRLSLSTPAPSLPPPAKKLLPPGKFPLTMTPAEAAQSAVINSLGMKLVPVPGTDVLFCIHETRYKDYAAYARETPDADGHWKNQKIDGVAPEGDAGDHPVFEVSWDEARAFCRWLSQKEGKTYRLPKDREWSFAVGIGEQEEWTADTTPKTVFKPQKNYPWEGAWPPPPGAGNYRDETRRKKVPRPDAKYVDGYDDGYAITAPVMSFRPNKLGLYDMGGNVWEWIEDAYDTTPGDPIARGGSWSNPDPWFTRSSFRLQKPATLRDPSYGFRIVLVP